ncbi:hypothetical protein L210DRAFT_75251 [Boletus edulis BED1]|uniref:Uncharacterized protein n=1 Tax=Boletus edulis BED1 TaxID=1328754 RepID=A0AAD4GGP4_BOLED|nr:hypothetical protein L210DRAFT_75251 [Boletus edulis BED1]
MYRLRSLYTTHLYMHKNIGQVLARGRRVVFCCVSVASRYPTALAPPPHHRRAPCSLGSIQDIPFRHVALLRSIVCTQ